jgi:hypothetical protein
VTLFDSFSLFDAELAKHGQPACSDFWQREVKRFLDAWEEGRALEWWAAVGRGGAKSTVIYKLSLFFTLHVSFDIPIHEVHYATIISRNKIEAAKSLAIISRWLTALNIAHDPTGEKITIPDLHRGVRVLSASVGGTSGWRSYMVALDEFSKWSRDNDAVMLDADEVKASAMATAATHATAPVLVMSTPWIDQGSFYETITHPPDGVIVTPCTPSWAANPVITEAATRKRERHPRRWQREYACEFVPTFEDGFFDPLWLDAATDKYRPGMATTPQFRAGYMVAIDPAFKGDMFAICVSHAEAGPEGLPKIVIDHCSVIAKDPATGMVEPSRAVAIVASYRQRFGGAQVVYSDQHQADTLKLLFVKHRIALQVEPWTAAMKTERYAAVQTLFRDGRIRIPDDKALRAELSSIGLRRLPSGNEVISYRGAHDDRASAFVHAAWIALKYAPVLVGEYAQVPIAVGERRLASYFRPDTGNATMEQQIAASYAEDRDRVNPNAPMVVTRRERW